MIWRLLTVLAVAMLAFYAGVVAESARSPSYSISVPDSVPTTIPIAPTGPNVRVVETTSYGFAESQSDWVAESAAGGAVAAALFLLARGAVLVARRVRPSGA